MIINYSGKVFSMDEFILEGLPNTFLADVRAIVLPGTESIDVEITSVLMAIERDPHREISAFLKSEAERDLQMLMRSYYLNQARQGLEGDVLSSDNE